MKVYEILVPAFGPGIQNRRSEFTNYLREKCGGYTCYDNVDGFWRDPQTGKEYVDTMVAFRFGLNLVPDDKGFNATHNLIIRDVIQKASALWPYERAFAITVCGDMTIYLKREREANSSAEPQPQTAALQSFDVHRALSVLPAAIAKLEPRKRSDVVKLLTQLVNLIENMVAK